MKRVLSVVLSISILFSVVSSAYINAFAETETGFCGRKLTYSFNFDNGQLTISGTGDMYDYSEDNNSPFSFYDIKSIVVNDGVTSVGEYAFANANVESVTIPASLLTINNYSFFCCHYLDSVNVPNNVTTIGDNAFDSCTSLSSVTIPKSVKTIGDKAFEKCWNLSNLTLKNGVKSIGEYAFYDCKSIVDLNIPNSVITISSDAFNSCNSLKNITFGSGVKNIDDYAFFGCNSISKVNITDLNNWCNITFGNQYSNPLFFSKSIFVNNINTTSLTIPTGIQNLKNYVFTNCESLNSLSIPSSVNKIEKYAFFLTSDIKDIYYDGSKTDWCRISETSDYKESEGVSYHFVDSCKHIFTNAVTPSTCSNQGYTTYTCSICGFSYVDEFVPSIPHIPNPVVKTPSNCVCEGVIEYNCAMCNIFMKSEITPALGHSWNDGVETKPSTETETGIMTYTCTVCEITQEKTIPCKPHVHIPAEVVKESIVEPTCTKLGSYVEVIYCQGCQEVLSRNVIPVSEKGHAWNDGTVIIEATETEQGVIEYVCTACSASKTEPYTKDHFHSSSAPVKENVVDATCKNDGSYDEVVCCSVCEKELDRIHKLIPRLNHTYSVSLIQPTCFLQGFTLYTCIKCDYSYKDSYTDALDHEWSDEIISKTPTEFEEGESYRKCSLCDAVIKTTIPKLPHRHSGAPAVKENVVNATCTDQGSYDEVVYCSVCNEELFRNSVTINKLGHNKVKTIYPAIKNNKSHSGGTVIYYCTKCNVNLSTGNIEEIKSIELNKTSFIYDGKTKKPSVRIATKSGDVSNNDYTVTYLNNTKVGKATVKIKFKNYYKGEVTKTFAINPKGTTINKLSATRKGFKVVWNKQKTQTTGYQIQYATNKKFNNAKTITVAKNSTASKSVTKLTANKKYYVRIRTYKTVSGKKYCSSWSKMKSIITKK